MSESIWLLGLFGAAALLMLSHRQGLRLNAALARAVARELEEALSPTDATYTWIGGAIGFHAIYEVAEGRTVKATATFLPRQSPLYLPVAFIVSGASDRLQLTFELGRPVAGRAHLFEPSYLRLRFADRDGLAGLSEASVDVDARTFVTFASDDGLAHWLEQVATAIEGESGLARSLRHVALTGGEIPSLYALVVPRRGMARGAAAALASLSESLPA